MPEIIRQQSPASSSGTESKYTPDQLNADLAAASLAKDLISKLPTPAIDTRKFTIIHGLMQSLNHIEPDAEKEIKGNPTYINTAGLIELMDRVSEKSVNVDGRYFQNLFAYLMKPKYIIQGMPQSAAATEEKQGFLSTIWGKITGRGQQQQQGAQQ